MVREPGNWRIIKRWHNVAKFNKPYKVAKHSKFPEWICLEGDAGYGYEADGFELADNIVVDRLLTEYYDNE